MEQISKNFALSEFSASTTARQKGISNEIPETVKPAVRALVLNLLQPICDYAGWRDRINSGYRCPALNAAVGGAATSQHVKGEAADNAFYGASGNIPTIDVLREVLASGLPFDQMIAYPTFVHLSYVEGRPNRKEVLYSSTYKGPRL